jgi:dipeptidase E
MKAILTSVLGGSCYDNGKRVPGPNYQRWLKGLGITKTNIFPHFDALRDEMLDGMRLIEDITFEDSMGHEFLALNNGSYIVVEDGKEEIFGDAYSIKDGKISKVN